MQGKEIEGSLKSLMNGRVKSVECLFQHKCMDVKPKLIQVRTVKSIKDE